MRLRGKIATVALTLAMMTGMTVAVAPPAQAGHTHQCGNSNYPWIRYRMAALPIPNAWVFYWVNVSTGATHSHYCYGVLV